ncbi:hypothetical protein LIER_10433 [Lithospermum erythrorhizon]|uniref:Uncharacterized protein n=1 Tax=Lithospermum erythrorhizon TaxID=34254 RepID=A0AAV3PN99_LITER
MALKHFALIFLCSLFLFSSHEIEARDSQMFNKIPSNTNDVQVEVKQSQQNLPKKEATDPSFNPGQQQEEEQPNFIPENTENNYGLYGHESGQFPPSTQTQENNNNNNKYFPYNAKYLPKNYNTEAYVTQPLPEDSNENSFIDNSYTNTPTNNNNNYQTQDNSNKYYTAQKKDMNNVFDSMDTEDDTFANDNINNYYKTDSANNINGYYNNDVVSNNNNIFNTRFMDASETTNNNNNMNYYSSVKSRVNRVEPQGMSDTRLMENGKYNYDINSGTYNRDHPYVNTMAMRNRYNPTEYNNIDNSNQYNNFNEEEEQYQNEDNMP